MVVWPGRTGSKRWYIRACQSATRSSATAEPYPAAVSGASAHAAVFQPFLGAPVRLLLGQTDGECVGLPLGLFPLVAAQVVEQTNGRRGLAQRAEQHWKAPGQTWLVHQGPQGGDLLFHADGPGAVP